MGKAESHFACFFFSLLKSASKPLLTMHSTVRPKFFSSKFGPIVQGTIQSCKRQGEWKVSTPFEQSVILFHLLDFPTTWLLFRVKMPSNNVCFGFKNRMRQWWCISLCQSQGHDHLVYMQFSILDGIAAGGAAAEPSFLLHHSFHLVFW